MATVSASQKQRQNGCSSYRKRTEAVHDTGSKQAVTLPCNTTSFFAPQIHQWCEGTQTRFLSMADATGGWLRREGVKKVALVGINYVADLGHWSAYREPMSGMEIELLDSDALGNVRKLADEVKQKGPSLKLLSKLHHILQRSITSRNVVLALTELSLLVELQRGEDKSGKLFTDPMRIYADALVRAYLGLPGGDSI